ncbi:MAG: hypothetical protein DMG06_01300 [Acidobacteria bacterium]|nr:MAG: hypothetical protein DMG06_01300 [Acidobacteriota bacterium]
MKIWRRNSARCLCCLPGQGARSASEGYRHGPSLALRARRPPQNEDKILVVTSITRLVEQEQDDVSQTIGPETEGIGERIYARPFYSQLGFFP